MGCWEVEGDPLGKEALIRGEKFSGEGDSYALFVTNTHSDWWMTHQGKEDLSAALMASIIIL